MLLNGELLRAAEESKFDVFVTTDKNLAHQQNLSRRKIAVVVIGQTRWRAIQPMLERLVQEIEGAKPGSYTVVEIPN